MALSETVRVQVRFSEVDSIKMVWHRAPALQAPLAARSLTLLHSSLEIRTYGAAQALQTELTVPDLHSL